MEFPKKENDIEALGFSVMAGLNNHSEDFPAPPVAPPDFGPLVMAFQTAKQTVSDAEGAYNSAVTAKTEALTALVVAMKKDLRYAENVTDFDNDKLVLLGWGGRKTPTPASPPASPRDLQADDQGPGTLELSWRKPAQNEGGSVRAFMIHRREQTGGEVTAWHEIATALEPEIHLDGQPQGVKMEYRVVAANTSGTSLPSNVVALVL